MNTSKHRGGSKQITEAYFRGLMHSVGYRRKDLDKPQIAVVNSWTDVNNDGIPQWKVSGNGIHTQTIFNINSPRTFRLNCDAGAGPGLGQISISIDVLKVDVQASPSPAYDGGSSKITWDSDNATECEKTAGDWSSLGIVAVDNLVGESVNIVAPSPNSFELTCRNGSEKVVATKNINVLACGSSCENSGPLDSSVNCTPGECASCIDQAACQALFKSVQPQQLENCFGANIGACPDIIDNSTCDCSGDPDAVNWIEN